MNNRTAENRAEEAFKKALETSESYSSGPDVQNWLLESEKLNNAALEGGNVVMDPLPKDMLNCRSKMGWLQRAFVLSYYYLLRYKEY